MAFTTRRPADGVIFHCGAQRTSKDYAALASANGMILSVSRKGQCWHNAVAESFFATVKRELINDQALADPGRAAPGGLRLHRGLVQHPPAPFRPRLSQPRRIRISPPQRRPASGMINSRNLSAKADQAHRRDHRAQFIGTLRVA
jgi:transposase InsO family protein